LRRFLMQKDDFDEVHTSAAASTGGPGYGIAVFDGPGGGCPDCHLRVTLKALKLASFSVKIDKDHGQMRYKSIHVTVAQGAVKLFEGDFDLRGVPLVPGKYDLDDQELFADGDATRELLVTARLPG